MMSLDLVLERVVDLPPELVWQAWTQPEHLKAWFVPKPWSVVEAEVDLRPGGIFRVVTRSPQGEVMPSEGGCILEVVENRRLVWTDALRPGFRPSDEPFFTAIIELEPQAGGTRYRVTARHRDEEDRKLHEEMGFLSGWGTCLDQLVAHMKSAR